MQAWDSVLIKSDSNNPDKGRAGVVQAVTKDANGVVLTATIRLDETQKGDPVKTVTADATDLTRLG